MNRERDTRALVIAGGFGTRIGLDGPKGLIKVGETTIVGRMMEEVLQIPRVKKLAITTNAKFHPQYAAWLAEQPFRNRILLLNNHVQTNEGRLGAIGDIIYALQELGWQDSNLLIMPSDTLYEFKIKEFLQFAQTLNPLGLVTVACKMDRARIARRQGCVITDGIRVTNFVEKPEEPPSDLAVIPFYYYPKKYIPELQEYQQKGGSLDAPSSIISWFIEKKLPVYAFETDEYYLDVGTRPDLLKIQDPSKLCIAI